MGPMLLLDVVNILYLSQCVGEVPGNFIIYFMRRSFQNSIDFGKATALPTGSKT
jgi:hypothetical protein